MSEGAAQAFPLYVVVVIYNQDVEDSTTLRSLRRLDRDGVGVIVVDNSTRSNGNEPACERLGWAYITSHENMGLSRAYNRALDYLAGKSGAVVWMDDDSSVTQGYFDELERIFAGDLADIAAPVIRAQDGRLYSPNEAGFFRNRQLRRPDQEVDPRRFNAINSCTAVSLRVYEGYRYDERLFLDQVDQKFFDDQRERGMRFRKMETVIDHDFSLKGDTTAEQVMKRYELRIRDFATYCRIQGHSRLACRLKIMLWGLAEWSRDRDGRLLRFFLASARRAGAAGETNGSAAARPAARDGGER